MAVEAVIWDFGGVMTTSPFEAFNRYEAEKGLPKDFIRRVNSTNPDNNAWALFERAEISPAQFDGAFAKDSLALGHEVRGGDVLPLLGGDVRPRMVAALEQCRANFRVGCITNNMRPSEGGVMTDLIPASAQKRRERMAYIMGLFHEVIESSKIGIRKPDPRIYTMMCETLGVSPSASVFLDDLGINLKPARAMGMVTIKVENEDQALKELSAATGLTFG